MCLLFSGLTEETRLSLLLKLITVCLQIPIAFGCQTSQISRSIDTKNLTVDPVGNDAELVFGKDGGRFINHKRLVSLLTVSINCQQTSLRILSLCKKWPTKNDTISARAPFGADRFLMIEEN